MGWHTTLESLTLQPERIETFLRQLTLHPRTPRTITDPDMLRQDLRRVRSRGFSVDDEEIFSGLRCVAAPIFGLDGAVVAGLSVAGPTSRIPKDLLPQFAAKVVGAAQAISSRLV
jgi:IclR family transcriptional regulator, acetate operon repressor